MMRLTKFYAGEMHPEGKRCRNCDMSDYAGNGAVICALGGRVICDNDRRLCPIQYDEAGKPYLLFPMLTARGQCHICPVAQLREKDKKLGCIVQNSKKTSDCSNTCPLEETTP